MLYCFQFVVGIAECATLLQQQREALGPNANVVVTLNGDFLWRSEYDRQDKGYH